MNTINKIFESKILADDLVVVRKIYADYFAKLDGVDWDKPVKSDSKEWNLHESIAHLVALNGDGLESIKRTLRGMTFTFVGLDDRYKFNVYNRKGIDDHLDVPMQELDAQLLNILDQAAFIACNMQPGQGELTAEMPIYNRPVRIVEILSILIFHIGLVHSAQVTEPLGLPPLWKQYSPEFRHRIIGRTMLPLSLLYHRDIGGSLSTTFAFRIGGLGGGEWYVNVAPDSQTFGEASVEHPGLLIHMREPTVFYQMLTGRMNPALALLRGDLKLRGNLRLFLQMGKLFSVDAMP